MMLLRLFPPLAAVRFRRRWASPLAGMRLASWLPLLLLLLALSTMYLFGDGWERFDHSRLSHNWDSAKNLAIAENFSPSHNFLIFLSQRVGDGGAPTYEMYNRFPVGSFALIKLVIMPFGNDLSAKVYAARMLMLLMFAGAAALAYLSLRRITSHPWIALAATASAFSGYYLLYFNDVVSNEMSMDLFAVLLAFHGMTVFIQEGRFGQLLAKTGLALLIGWHVYALLLPFIVLGLSREIIGVLRGNMGGNAVTPAPRSVGAALIRSRYIKLGAVALMFGLLLMSFNFANEYAALGGETPLWELPSVLSMLRRTSVDPAIIAATSTTDWGTFLPAQFERIGRIVLPAALTTQLDGLGLPYPRDTVSLPYLVAGMAAVGACLLGLLLLRRRRLLLSTLALSGLCWGIGMRANTAMHSFEAMFYVGIPLTLFTMVLLALRQRWPRLPAVVAVAALAVLVISNYQVSRTAPVFQYDAEIKADFQEIREFIPGKRVYFESLEIYHTANASGLEIYYHFNGVGHYYIAGSIIQPGESTVMSDVPVSDCGPRCGRYYDFVISGNRDLFPEKHLLTPSNRHIFLFDAEGIEDTYGINDRYRSEYEAVVSGGYGEPVAQSRYDLFMDDGKLLYYKNGCSPADTADRFYLHLIPENEKDLPENRRQYGFEIQDFDFSWRGGVFDGDCLAIAPLPDYPIARIRSGQHIEGQESPIWGAELLGNISKYAAEYDTIASGGYGEPAGRGVFDVYLNETAVVYFKEPCGVGDTGARFFVHWFPSDDGDLPAERREYGFDNAGFGFAGSGVMTGGRCLAVAPLPGYAVDRVRTGQFVPGEGQIWAVEFAGGR